MNKLYYLKYNINIITKIILIFNFLLIKSITYASENFKKGQTQLQIASRALIIRDKKLLLVSDDGDFWYTPGGKLEEAETLTECVVREVMEETGLYVEPKNMIFVSEFFDEQNKVHKVELYFRAEIRSGEINSKWKDTGGSVKFVNFFSYDEIVEMKKIAPKFLKEGKWLSSEQNPYKGFWKQGKR